MLIGWRSQRLSKVVVEDVGVCREVQKFVPKFEGQSQNGGGPFAKSFTFRLHQQPKIHFHHALLQHRQ